MRSKTELEYVVDPSDLFEDRTLVDLPIGTAVIEAGRAVVTLRRPANSPVPSQIAAATQALRCVLQVRQLLVHREFSLRGPNITHYRANGARDIVVLAEAAKSEWHVNPVDFRLTDAAGRVVRDSRAERVANDTEFVQRIAVKATKSPTMQQMLASYSMAVGDASDELVHLYEIRDAVATHFGGETGARKALQLSRNEWSHLGHLANDAPLRQGRHRGQKGPVLREARVDEMEAARRIARKILEAFADLV